MAKALGLPELEEALSTAARNAQRGQLSWKPSSSAPGCTWEFELDAGDQKLFTPTVSLLSSLCWPELLLVSFKQSIWEGRLENSTTSFFPLDGCNTLTSPSVKVSPPEALLQQGSHRPRPEMCGMAVRLSSIVPAVQCLTAGCQVPPRQLSGEEVVSVADVVRTLWVLGIGSVLAQGVVGSEAAGRHWRGE